MIAAAVHLRHRPALAPAPAAPTTGWPTRPGSTPADAAGAARRRGHRRRPASSAAAGRGRRASTRVLASGLPVVVLGGEQTPDAELMELSTVPGGVVAEAHAYLAHGGPANLAQLHRFLSDTVLLTGTASTRRRRRRRGACSNAPTSRRPTAGRPSRSSTTGPTTLAGNTAFVDALADAIEAAGGRRCRCSARRCARPSRSCSRRCAPPTRWSSPCSPPAARARRGRSRRRRRGLGRRRARRSSTCRSCRGSASPRSREQWRDSDDGLSPAGLRDPGRHPGVRRPADHRAVLVQGDRRRRPDLATSPTPSGPRGSPAIAVKHARLRHVPPAERRIVVMLSAYPTKHARIGNAVGLDTPASTVRLLAALRERATTSAPTASCPASATQDGDALIHALIAAGGQDEDWLTEEQLPATRSASPAADYRALVRRRCPPTCATRSSEHWGPAPGELFVDRSPIRTARSCWPRCGPATSW